jgi:hypothetical protein
MKALLSATLVLVGVVFAIACGDDSDGGPPGDAETPTATDTPASEPTQPGTTVTPAPEPGLFLVDPATGDGTSATPGTRCWYNSCIDYIGPITRAEPFAFDAGAVLGWQAEGATADTVSHAWIPAGDAESELTSDGTLAWRVANPEYAAGDITVPTTPGDYLLLVFIRYTNNNDVSWGLFVTAQ